MITQAPLWTMAGGLYGAFVVLMVTYAAPLLGFAIALTIIMLGQLAMGIVIDAFGLFALDPVPISPLRVIGCIIVAIGIFLIYLGKRKQEKGRGERTGKVFLMGTLAFAGGVVSAIQSPTNSTLAEIVGRLESTTFNFIVGFTAIFIATLIVRKGHPMKVRTPGARAWMFTGGAFGSIAIFMNILATPHLGVALLVEAMLLGQLATGAVVDSFGLMRSPKLKMNGYRYLGVVIISIGVVIVTAAKSM